MKLYTLLLLGMIFSYQVAATIWHVGPTEDYTMPSQVSTLVQDGDTVEIEPGVYAEDVAQWTANNLLLKGRNGIAQLPSNGLTYGGKAIWVIAGDNTTVENIDFSQAACVDMNGAGIRQEGHNLIVRHCKFHDNQEGILAGTVNPSNILIEFCEFANNGAGDGYSHNLYINHIDTFTFRYNYSHGAIVGHELKSRANVNFILYNRISDELTGTASRSIDLPNGGTSYVIGNVIEQGPVSENSNIIGYGLEGFTNPSPNELYAINNTIINNRVGDGSFFHLDANTALFKAYNNILAGSGSFVYPDFPANIDTASNIITTDIASFAFVDTSIYDYRLTVNSVSVNNNGTDAGIANGLSLNPEIIYVHQIDSAMRCISGVLDVGAYEYCSIMSLVEEIDNDFSIYPNPTSGIIYFNTLQQQIKITDVFGRLMFEADNVEYIDLNDLVNGLYFIHASSLKKAVVLNK